MLSFNSFFSIFSSSLALTFDLEVDAAKSRVGSYDAASGTLGGGVVTRELTLSSPGPAGRSCQTFTFALKVSLCVWRGGKLASAGIDTGF